MRKITERFEACGLRVNPDKTRIVCCKDVNRKEDHPATSLTFLGYTFRPRQVKEKHSRIFTGFTPAVSRGSLKTMRQTIRGWHLQLKSDKQIEELSKIRLGDGKERQIQHMIDTMFYSADGRVISVEEFLQEL
jgi:RNA-directed DNA polymerase